MRETYRIDFLSLLCLLRVFLRKQFGIPPETIKDSMRLGLPVPQVYIVPVERFCREMGPALGVNLAEFEFPAYFNFFVYKKRCTLVVDSADAEQNIRRVFSETLLGPAQFRREDDPIAYEPEDFSSDFNRDAIPNFQKELKHFRIMPDGHELVLETLLNFRHFHTPVENVGHDNLGIIRPSMENEEDQDDESESDENAEATEEMPKDVQGVEKREKTPWTYNQARWMGKSQVLVYPCLCYLSRKYLMYVGYLYFQATWQQFGLQMLRRNK